MAKVSLNWVLGLLLIAGLASIGPRPVPASTERTLAWEDLMPPETDLRAPFKHLSQVQISDLYELHKMHSWRRTDGGKNDTAVSGQIDELTAKLTAQDLDVAALLKKMADALDEYKKQQSTPVAGLNGEMVRLPGYVLPLEFGGQAVSEFFLVPYVGACIHTPPPPANQIVLVKLKQSYKVSGLYDAVWVTGRLKVVENKRQLGYRDGVGRVASTYEIEGMKIVPYEN